LTRHDRAKDDVLLPVGIDQVNRAVRHQLDDAFSDRPVDIVGRYAGARAAAIASAPVRAILPSSLSRASISIVEILVTSSQSNGSRGKFQAIAVRFDRQRAGRIGAEGAIRR
jgi:hypothetical protein